MMAATMTTEFVNDAKVMSKGQVTIPKNVREALGIDVGDRVTFIVDGNEIADEGRGEKGWFHV